MKGDFAITLKRLLKERKMTQRQLSKAIGIGEPQIYKYVHAVAIPRARVVDRIEDALGVQRGTLHDVIAQERAGEDGDTHEMSTREEQILSAWNRGARTAEEVAEITGYSLRVVGLYLPLGIEKEYV